MSTLTNTISDYKSNSLQKKSSFRRDGSYRIFHITKKQKEESDDDDNVYIKTQQMIEKANDIKPKSQKKSFKISNRNGLDGWKRKSTKNKRLLFLHKTSCESTSNEMKTSPSSQPLTNDLSSSIISNNTASNQLFKNNKQNNRSESSELDALAIAIDDTIIHDHATLNDLLARANKLEITEFNQIQPLSRASIHRKRKRFIMAFSTVLLVLIIIITIVIFVVVLKLRYKSHTNQTSKSPSIDDPYS